MSVVNVNGKRSKMIGVWVDGVLKLQTRDSDKAYEAANMFMGQRNRGVWLAPVGSFYI